MRLPLFMLPGFLRYDLEGGALFIRERPPFLGCPSVLPPADGCEHYLLSVPNGLTPQAAQFILVLRMGKNSYRYAIQTGSSARIGTATSIRALQKLTEEAFP